MLYENTPEDLKKAFEAFNVRHSFKPGDIVRWKEGMKHKRSEGPFVVMEVLDAPVVDPEQESGSAYFREPLDIIVATVNEGVGFVRYHADSRRLEPAE